MTPIKASVSKRLGLKSHKKVGFKILFKHSKS